MIDSYKKLRSVIDYEKNLYPNSFLDHLTRNQRVFNWKIVKTIRILEFLSFKAKKNYLYVPIYVFFLMRKNRIGVRIGVEIDHKTFDKGLLIHHCGNIVVNSGAKIGKNCQLHGDNCIGNKGANDPDKCPIIGDNVDIGVGAKILGGITLGDNVTVGANAVVVSSFPSGHVVIAGVPAKVIRTFK